MAYIGQGIKEGTFKVLDTSGNTYNGSNVTFSLGTQVGSAAQLLVSHDGVIQLPGTDYTLATGGTQITFSTAPASGASIFIVEISGAVGGTVTPSDNSVGVTQLNVSDGSNGQALTTNGSGTLSFSTISTGLTGIDDQSSSNDDQVTITDTAVVINEDSDDVDFRVESNGNANMLFVSGGNDVVGIGAEGDLGNGLHVKSADSGASVANEADELVVEASGDSGISILSGTGNTGGINFGDSGDNDIGRLVYDQSGNSMRFVINASERMRIISTGNLCFAKSSDSFGTAGHILYGETGSVGGTQFTSQSGVVSLSLNRLNDGEVLGFFSESSKEGNVSISGSTTSYNTFCGTHWSRLADNSKPSILRGTVMESIGTMMTWYQAVAEVAESTDEDGNVTPAHQVKESISLPNGKSVGDAVTFTSQGKEYTGKYVKEDNEQLPMCKISDTEESKGVYGVFMTWDDTDNGLDGDVNDMYVAALGAFVVRIHKDETVAIGDYLQSKGDGTAKKQADDILRASTIAKVTSTEKTHTYDDGSYCVPCTLHCG
jgi:hypothetical protein